MFQTTKNILVKVPALLRSASARFSGIDGGQRAAAFSFNAFLAFFPLMLLLASLSSALFGQAAGGKTLLAYMANYAPMGGEVFATLSAMLNSRGQAGIFAFLVLAFAASQFLTSTVRATNKAWGLVDYSWWKDPLKELALLGIIVIIVFAGIAVPLAGNVVRNLLPSFMIFSWAYSLWIIFLPWLALFAGLALFYRFAPHRRTRFSEIWVPALLATILLHLAQSLFVFYLRHFSTLTLIYGALGGVIAMLLWIYISGVIFVFCACLCAAQAEIYHS